MSSENERTFCTFITVQYDVTQVNRRVVAAEPRLTKTG